MQFLRPEASDFLAWQEGIAYIYGTITGARQKAHSSLVNSMNGKFGWHGDLPKQLGGLLKLNDVQNWFMVKTKAIRYNKKPRGLPIPRLDTGGPIRSPPSVHPTKDWQ